MCFEVEAEVEVTLPICRCLLIVFISSMLINLRLADSNINAFHSSLTSGLGRRFQAAPVRWDSTL